MKRLLFTNFSLRFPWLILALVVAATLFFASRFPNVSFDNDPENMLAQDEFVRVFHHHVQEKFNLYDFVIVGIVNKDHPHGVFNVPTLTRIDTLTRQLLNLRQGPDGYPRVPAASGLEEERRLDLQPDGTFARMLRKAFRQNPNDLFTEDGSSVIITRELIAPSVVDNIKQAEWGSLKLEYLMEQVPTTQEEALALRDDVMMNPLYNGTLVSEDGNVLCIYIPITEKTYSFNVASLVRALTAEWEGEEEIYITGLPVAQDTFGVEMLIQMVSSAPLAGLAIFLLLLAFFRRVSLIIAPMLVAIVSVVCTMGLLIGLGFDVHIMSSMIAIFLMPIAVADAVHILSEFFDVYHRFNDKAQTLRHVVSHLFMPMLYTSLTTIAGFASLAATPIPPVRVFGLHVAFGVALAWILTMTFVPAFIMLFIPQRTLQRISDTASARAAAGTTHTHSPLSRFLVSLGSASARRARTILAVATVIVVISIAGVTRIQVNDNPVKWFSRSHPMRIADTVLNNHFNGTYTAYFTLKADPNAAMTARDMARTIRQQAQARFGEIQPEALHTFLQEMARLEDRFCNILTADPESCFDKLTAAAAQIDATAMASWNAISEEILYLDPEGLTPAILLEALQTLAEADARDVQTFTTALLAEDASLDGHELLDQALALADRFTALSFEQFVRDMRTELSAPAFKQPQVLRYLEALQRHLHNVPVVGKTTSAADAVKKAAYELLYQQPPAGLEPEEAAQWQQQNQANFAVPDSAAATGQVFIQLEGMKKRDSIFHMVTRNYQEANLWVQLTSGDNRDMQTVVDATAAFMEQNPPPIPLEPGWAGLTYLNVVWQDRMVSGMFSSLISSFIVVLVMMMLLFRSPLFGVLSMIPLSLTILFIYGLIGWIGKDYDMPVAVLSSLTLGLSVDFAIHFLERAREEQTRCGSWMKACGPMFREPAAAISRNAITISIGFTPLLLAPLVPYRTVGFFLATIMAVSWMSTLVVLPALLTVLRRIAFGETAQPDPDHDTVNQT